MELGMVGLGRMGANMAERLVRGGHRVVGYDPNPEAVQRAVTKGIAPADSLQSLASQLNSPRVVWLMVPAGPPVDQTMSKLRPHLAPGDVIVDGGNSNYKDTIQRASWLFGCGFRLLDCGTSGGIWGLQEGYSLMIGGDAESVQRVGPIFQTLAPAPDRGWG